MLKQLIQRLLDSRTTPAQAANSAMPEGAKQEITPSLMTESMAWQKMHEGISTDNGYIQAEGRGSTAGKSQLMIGQSANDFRSFTNTFEASGLNICFAPVKKGQLYYVYGSNLKSLAISFFKSVGKDAIGGGYNRFVQRAVLCLRPSFNYLPRSFCKAKSLGLQNNRRLQVLMSPLLRKQQVAHTENLRLLLSTVTVYLSNGIGALQWARQNLSDVLKIQQIYWGLVPILMQGGFISFSLLRKATRFMGESLWGQLTNLCSLKLQVKPNLMIGGESC